MCFVASALEFDMRMFVTFEVRQKQLAHPPKLKVLALV
jgi:hypothetical protein